MNIKHQILIILSLVDFSQYIGKNDGKYIPAKTIGAKFAVDAFMASAFRNNFIFVVYAWTNITYQNISLMDFK